MGGMGGRYCVERRQERDINTPSLWCNGRSERRMNLLRDYEWMMRNKRKLLYGNVTMTWLMEVIQNHK